MEKYNNSNLNSFYKGVDRRNTNAIKWDVLTINQNNLENNDVLPFWIADSDYPTADFIINDLVQRVKHGAFGYTYCSDEYYNTIKNWIQRRYNYSIEKDWIIPTHGVVTALDILVKLLTNENDNIVVSTPVYNPFFNVVNNNNRVLVCNKLLETTYKDNINIYNTYQIDFCDLESKLKDAKMYILCNPHNPVGRVWNKEEIDKIVSLCKKYDVILVSDEIHCDLIMDGKRHYSVGHYLDDYDKVVICTAPSKVFNLAGLMNANVICKNEDYRKKYNDFQHCMSLSTPNLLSLVACESAYKKGDEWVDDQNKYLTENRDIVYKFFGDNLPKAKTYKLEGTYLMWVNVSYLGLKQEELLENLIKGGIKVNSGTVYSSDYKGYIRLNIATSRDYLLEGLERIKKVLLK